MDWTDRFDGLTATQQLSVAAMMAERVMPLAGNLGPLDDGLRLVWMQVGGHAASKQDLARALNRAIESAKSGEPASQATIAVLESALHNADASRDAIVAALEAVANIDAPAAQEEAAWLRWAIDVAAETPVPSRTTFAHSSSPVSGWMARVSSANLPLFGAPANGLRR